MPVACVYEKLIVTVTWICWPGETGIGPSGLEVGESIVPVNAQGKISQGVEGGIVESQRSTSVVTELIAEFA